MNSPEEEYRIKETEDGRYYIEIGTRRNFLSRLFTDDYRWASYGKSKLGHVKPSENSGYVFDNFRFVGSIARSRWTRVFDTVEEAQREAENYLHPEEEKEDEVVYDSRGSGRVEPDEPWPRDEEPEMPPLQYKKEHEEEAKPPPMPNRPPVRYIPEAWGAPDPTCAECYSEFYRERVVSWLPWPTRKTDRCINPGCPNAHPNA